MTKEQPLAEPAWSLQLKLFIAWITAIFNGESTDVIAQLHQDFSTTCNAASGSQLRTRLRLGESEQHVTWLLGAIAMDSTIRKHVAALSGTETGDPTLDALKKIIYSNEPPLQVRNELSPRGRLRRLRIIERSDGGSATLHETRQTWAIADRVLEMLLGGTSVDYEIEHLATTSSKAPQAADLAISPAALAETRRAMASGASICVCGMPGLGRSTLLRAVAAEYGVSVLEIACGKLPIANIELLVTQVRRIARECLLLQRVPLLRELHTVASDVAEIIGDELVTTVGRVFATSHAERPGLRWSTPMVLVDMHSPSSNQRAQVWARALQVDDAIASEFANQYPMAPALIMRAAAAAKVRVTADEPMTHHDIRAGIRTVLDDSLSGFAKHQQVTQRLADLVLAADHLEAVQELIARIRNRATVEEAWDFAAKVGNKGLGVTALFAGPPGTGKSMCAAAIAHELGIDLYSVDMSKISSKWIGESEKALGALFDAAAAGHAILLFNEADSLFGKRTEQKSSNDKFANQETNFLLDKIESYAGICFLTSNHDGNIDPAFVRRLTLKLTFAMPDDNEREQLWQTMLPAAAPRDARIDFAALGRRWKMSGGHIRNAVLRAAFVAADRRVAISQSLLEHAAQIEAAAMGSMQRSS